MDNRGEVLFIVQTIERIARIAAEHGSSVQKSKVLPCIEALAQIAGDLLTNDAIRMFPPVPESQAS